MTEPPINLYPPLDEERALLERWPASQDEVIRAHFAYARWYAARILHRRKLDEDDEQEMRLGLCEAAKRFDPARGVRFSTFANYWIRRQLLGMRHRTRDVAVSFDDGKVSRRLTRARRKVLRAASDVEAAEAVGVPLDAAARFRRAQSAAPVYLDALAIVGPAVEVPAETRDMVEFAVVAGERSPVDDAEATEGLRILAAAVEKLSPRLRRVARWRIFGNETLAVVGQALGVTREWARQLELKARVELEKNLRRALRVG